LSFNCFLYFIYFSLYALMYYFYNVCLSTLLPDLLITTDHVTMSAVAPGNSAVYCPACNVYHVISDTNRATGDEEKVEVNGAATEVKVITTAAELENGKLEAGEGTGDKVKAGAKVKTSDVSRRKRALLIMLVGVVCCLGIVITSIIYAVHRDPSHTASNVTTPTHATPAALGDGQVTPTPDGQVRGSSKMAAGGGSYGQGSRMTSTG
jgi:hypothetical protein